jgi:nitrogen fixation protein NifU and related proteins
MSETYTLYNETVMEHFMNPRNMGDLKDADGVGEVGAAACGDIMKISLRIKDGKIEDARFKHLAAARPSPVPAWRRN